MEFDYHHNHHDYQRSEEIINSSNEAITPSITKNSLGSQFILFEFSNDAYFKISWFLKDAKIGMLKSEDLHQYVFKIMSSNTKIFRGKSESTLIFYLPGMSYKTESNTYFESFCLKVACYEILYEYVIKSKKEIENNIFEFLIEKIQISSENWVQENFGYEPSNLEYWKHENTELLIKFSNWNECGIKKLIDIIPRNNLGWMQIFFLTEKRNCIHEKLTNFMILLRRKCAEIIRHSITENRFYENFHTIKKFEKDQDKIFSSEFTEISLKFSSSFHMKNVFENQYKKSFGKENEKETKEAKYYIYSIIENSETRKSLFELKFENDILKKLVPSSESIKSEFQIPNNFTVNEKSFQVLIDYFQKYVENNHEADKIHNLIKFLLENYEEEEKAKRIIEKLFLITFNKCNVAEVWNIRIWREILIVFKESFFPIILFKIILEKVPTYSPLISQFPKEYLIKYLKSDIIIESDLSNGIIEISISNPELESDQKSSQNTKVCDITGEVMNNCSEKLSPELLSFVIEEFTSFSNEIKHFFFQILCKELEYYSSKQKNFCEVISSFIKVENSLEICYSLKELFIEIYSKYSKQGQSSIFKLMLEQIIVVKPRSIKNIKRAVEINKKFLQFVEVDEYKELSYQIKIFEKILKIEEFKELFLEVNNLKRGKTNKKYLNILAHSHEQDQIVETQSQSPCSQKENQFRKAAEKP